MSTFELCSLSEGLGREMDSLRFLYQETRANFEFQARLDDMSALGGLAGVMFRTDPRLDVSAFVAISVTATAAGGPQLASLLRPNTGAVADSAGAKPVPVALPLFLKVGRIGTRVFTAYSRDGQTYTPHLEANVDGSDLAFLFQRAGLMQSSNTLKQPMTARFSRPALSVEEEGFPPTLLDVNPATSPVGGGGRVVIIGDRLDDAVEVSLAGIPAGIVEASANRLVVIAGAAREPRHGGVRVASRSGSEVLEDAFAYFGKEFIRGDINGSGKVDLSDAVAGLNFLFQGGTPPQCFQAAEVNGDLRQDLSDSVFLLLHLFNGGPAPAAPYPLPGLPPVPSLPCDVDVGAQVFGISQESVAEGDEIEILGRGFSPDPERNVVFLGSSRVEVLKASETKLIARVGAIGSSQIAKLVVGLDRIDVFAPIFSCKATRCRPLFIATDILVSKTQVKMIASEGIKKLGESRFDARQNAIVLSVPRKQWDPTQTYDVNANLLLPAVHELSQGSRLAAFEFRHYFPRVTYGEWLEALVDELDLALFQRRRSREFSIVADEAGEQILFRLEKNLSQFVDARIHDSIVDLLFRPPVGRCGPDNLHPVNDRRAFGWCRLEELIEECNGLPKWEYFIPKNKVLQASSNIFPLPSPNTLSPSEKSVMYNKPAYCFVRGQELWNRCKLAELEESGKTQVPHFPRSAIVIKTSWRTAGQLPASPHPDNIYYHYDFGGQRRYLVAFHFTTKDVDDWYWADFYVPSPTGLGGCDGWNNDKPASITGVWANYYMCTNLEPEEVICGNTVFPECGVSTCTACHQHTPDGSGPFGTGAAFGSMGLDFLFSLGDGPQDPPGCP